MLLYERIFIEAKVLVPSVVDGNGRLVSHHKPPEVMMFNADVNS